jgi:hypothetical protein
MTADVPVQTASMVRLAHHQAVFVGPMGSPKARAPFAHPPRGTA